MIKYRSGMIDPTRDEMLAVIATMPFAAEYDAFDQECAIYWFANDWHSGQGSNLYSALSTSEYRPGRLERAPDETSRDVYDVLTAAFAICEA